MKKLLSLFFLCFTIATIAQNIPQRPNPPRLVNDFAHVLTSDQIESLERKLVDYDDSTSTQIVIVTVSTTGDYNVDDYALKILRDWGVGNKKTNNGIVILAAITDRKVKLEVGYGLEGAIPDITAKQIIDNEITPNFRETNYYRGFDQAADAIVKAAAGEYKAPEDYNRPNKHTKGGISLSFLLPLIVIIILIIIKSGGGGRGGGMMSRRGSNPFFGGLLGGIIGSSLGGGGGWSGGGGGGGGWSGGGGGGGGFGGFGGGSGGGGGASGSW